MWSLRTSLRAKLTLSILVPLLIILGGFTAFEYTRQQSAILNNLSLLASHSGKVIENNLRYAMRQSDFNQVQFLLDTISEAEEFRIVYLMDTAGEVIFAPQGDAVGTVLDQRKRGCTPCHSLPPNDRPSSIVIDADDGQTVFRSMQPIENDSECSTCHDAEQPLIGLLLIDIPMAPLEAELTGTLQENLLWRIGIILITVVVVNLVLSRTLMDRLEGLAKALTQFGRDHLAVRLPVGDPDEVGQLAIAFNEMGNRIEIEAAENRELSENLRRRSEERGELLNRLITAQEDERKRVARELHDQLGQALGGLAFQTERTQKIIESDPEGARRQLNEAKHLIDETSNKMYDLILDLRPSSLDDLGLVAALRTYTDRLLNGTDIKCELDVTSLNSRLTPEIETCLYRAFQEALNNAVRHAQASHVRLVLANFNGMLEGIVEDNGRGFNPSASIETTDARRGLGILGMQERVTQCGGQFKIDSQPGNGTRILIKIPLADRSGD